MFVDYTIKSSIDITLKLWFLCTISCRHHGTHITHYNIMMIHSFKPIEKDLTKFSYFGNHLSYPPTYKNICWKTNVKNTLYALNFRPLTITDSRKDNNNYSVKLNIKINNLNHAKVKLLYDSQAEYGSRKKLTILNWH